MGEVRYQERRDLVEDVDYLPGLGSAGLFILLGFVFWHLGYWRMWEWDWQLFGRRVVVGRRDFSCLACFVEKVTVFGLASPPCTCEVLINTGTVGYSVSIKAIHGWYLFYKLFFHEILAIHHT